MNKKKLPLMTREQRKKKRLKGKYLSLISSAFVGQTDCNFKMKLQDISNALHFQILVFVILKLHNILNPTFNKT